MIQGNPKSVEEPEMVSDDIAIDIPEEEEETHVAATSPSPKARNPANINFAANLPRDFQKYSNICQVLEGCAQQEDQY